MEYEPTVGHISVLSIIGLLVVKSARFIVTQKLVGVVESSSSLVFSTGTLGPHDLCKLTRR